LANLASSGVTGGALIIVGEDYGEGSSIMQERSHAFAMKSQIWLLDPRPDLPSIVKSVEDGFQLSEASSTPVMLELRIRSCHVHGSFIARDNKRPPYTLAQALDQPVRDVNKIVLPPASYVQEKEKIEKRWPAAVAFIKEGKLNETFDGDLADIGIALQGGMYNGVMRAVLIVEEGQPDFIEQSVNTILRRRDINTRLFGKDVLPMAGEYTPDVMLNGVRAFVSAAAPDALADADRAPNQPAIADDPRVKALAGAVPPRPPGFCTGCPERPIFAAMKLVEKELGTHHVAADIGCHLFSILPPFNIGASTMGYGLGPASAAAFNVPSTKKSISFIGDGGFWHNGLTTSIGNAVYNKHDGVIVVVDNYYASATGGQDVLSSRADNASRSTKHPITKAVEGVGATWVRQIDRTYDVAKMRDTLKEALASKEPGPKVIVASSECMLNRQRREKPLFNKAVKGGQRMVRERYGVDEDICNGDHACIRLSGCPSLSVKRTSDPLKDDPVAAVDN